MDGSESECSLTSPLRGSVGNCIELFHEIILCIVILHRKRPGNGGNRIRSDYHVSSDHLDGKIEGLPCEQPRGYSTWQAHRAVEIC